MNQQWQMLEKKVDSMSLRERLLTFAAIAAVLVALTKTFLLDPLLVEQKKLSAKMQQQQEKMKTVQAQMDASSQARRDVKNSPLHSRIEQARQQLADGDIYLEGLRERLEAPEKMAALLEQVLNQNGRLRLMDIHTLPVAPLTMAKAGGAGAAAASGVAAPDGQVFKHGVQLTVRGNYLDLMQYLADLEHLPSQMFWGKAEMTVEQHPEVELTLTLYTLSQDKTWLKI